MWGLGCFENAVLVTLDIRRPDQSLNNDNVPPVHTLAIAPSATHLTIDLLGYGCQLYGSGCVGLGRVSEVDQRIYLFRTSVRVPGLG